MERILVIADNLATGSPSAAALPLATALQNIEHEVQVAELGGQSSAEQRATWGITHIERPERFCWASYQRLQETIRDFQPDWIHAWGAASIRAAAVARWRHRVPFFAIHDSTAELGASHRRWLDRWAATQAHAQFCRSATRPDVLQLPLARPPQSSPASAQGLISKADLHRQLNIPADVSLVGTCARLIPATRMKDYAWAADMVCCIRDDVHFLLIGDGPQAWWLRRYIDHLDTRRNLHLMGWHEQTRQIIPHLDIYVETADWFDGCAGLVEAVSAGVPSVATSSPVHRQLIRHGVTGFVVERGARNEFARCINRLVNRPDIAHAFGSTARQLAGEVLSDYSELARIMASAMSQPDLVAGRSAAAA